MESSSANPEGQKNESPTRLKSKTLFSKSVDPRAMSNLWAAQWRDMNRAMWGGWGAGQTKQVAGGESRSLLAQTLSTGLTRSARLFMPDSAGPGAPLVVMLHGCMQDSESFARLTRMDQIAREQGFNVLYPDQDSSANRMQCWNWFAPENQARLGGEPEALATIVEQAQDICQAKPRHTWLAGISAGAALASSMAQLYPELFGAVALVAGPMPFSAKDVNGALEAMKSGTGTELLSEMRAKATRAGERRQQGDARVLPVLIVQGQADQTVNPAHAGWQEQSALLLNDALNDGRLDGAIQTLSESRSPGGETRVWRGAHQEVLAITVRPRDLGHAWSGGDPAEPFSQAGFDQSRLALEFFKAAACGDWSKFEAPVLAERLWGVRAGKENGAHAQPYLGVPKRSKLAPRA